MQPADSRMAPTRHHCRAHASAALRAAPARPQRSSLQTLPAALPTPLIPPPPHACRIGELIPTVIAGLPTTLYGTSVSAPTFAGVVMQLNAALRATPGLEGARLGYLNPFLYCESRGRGLLCKRMQLGMRVLQAA